MTRDSTPRRSVASRLKRAQRYGAELHLAMGEQMRHLARLEGFAEWVKYTKATRATIVRVAKMLTEGR